MLLNIYLVIIASFALYPVHGSLKKSKQRKASEVLRDSTNIVADVQPTQPSLSPIQNPPQKKSTPDTENTVKESPKTLLNGVHRDSLPLYGFSNLVQNRVPIKLERTFGDHLIKFDIYHGLNDISAEITNQHPISGQIKLQLLGGKKSTEGGQQEISGMRLATTFMTNGAAVASLGRLDDIQVLMLTNTQFCLAVEASILPGYDDDAYVESSLHGPVTGRKSQQTIQTIKQLMEDGNYEEIEKLADRTRGSSFMQYLIMTITKMEHYEGLSECIDDHEALSDFLAFGNMTLVKQLIIKKYDAHGYDIESFRTDTIDALRTTLIENMRDRAFNIMEAVHAGLIVNRERYPNEPMFYFEEFLASLMEHSKNDSILFRRFVTLHGEKFKDKHPELFDAFCRQLVRCLSSKIFTNSEKWIVAMIAQPSLLTAATFVKGFLDNDDKESDSTQAALEFISYGWKEAIVEGLKEDYVLGGRSLWIEMTKSCPSQFSGGYLESDKWRQAVCAHFKSKQALEMEWAEENASILQAKLGSLVSTLGLPDSMEIWEIVSGYAVAWTDVDENDEDDEGEGEDDEEEII